jgi:tetratricopeptide (TPR) repeat protein
VACGVFLKNSGVFLNGGLVIRDPFRLDFVQQDPLNDGWRLLLLGDGRPGDCGDCKKGHDESLSRNHNFQQAIAEDPDYALAYAGIADCYTRLSSFSMDPAGLTHPLANASAFRALQLESSLAEVHASLGFISFHYDWNWNSAEHELQQSLKLDPSYNAARHWYGDTLAVMGRLKEALDQVRLAERSDPLSPITNADLGWILYLNRRYDEAIAANRRTLELDSNFVRARTNLAFVYLQTGAFADAIQELEEVS